MGDRRGADPAFGADHRDDAAERISAGNGIELRNRPDEIENPKWCDEIFTYAACHQIAIENNVVDASYDDDLGPGIAELRQGIEILDERVAIHRRFENDDIRRRRAAVGFDGGERAAHVNLDMRLGHVAVADRLLDDRGDFLELLRRRPGSTRAAPARSYRLFVVIRLVGYSRFRGDIHQLLPTCPMLEPCVPHLVPGSAPRRSWVMARVRMATSFGSSARGPTRSRGSATWAANAVW